MHFSKYCNSAVVSEHKRKIVALGSTIRMKLIQSIKCSNCTFSASSLQRQRQQQQQHHRHHRFTNGFTLQKNTTHQMADSNRLGEKCQAKCTFFDAYFLLFLIINWKCNLNTLKFFETENMRIIFINVFFFLFILHTHQKKYGIFSSSSSWVERDVVLFLWKKCNLFAYIFFLQSNISFISKIYLQRQDCCCVVVAVVCWYFCFLLFFFIF